MALANLEQFRQDILKDPALQERLRTVTDRDSMVALIVQIGKEKGYNFSPEEVGRNLDELNASNLQQPIGEGLLAAIAGNAHPSAYVNYNCKNQPKQ